MSRRARRCEHGFTTGLCPRVGCPHVDKWFVRNPLGVVRMERESLPPEKRAPERRELTVGEEFALLRKQRRARMELQASPAVAGFNGGE